MNVALLQINLVWENPAENRKNIRLKINNLPEGIDLIVLPEMFTSGFTMNPKLVAEPMDGTTINWLQIIAKTNNCAITGSLVIKENDMFYNRMVFVYPNGDVKKYDKKHLFTLASEDNVYQAGCEKVIVDYNNFKICLQICYDLRFPVFSRNTENYDLLIYVASWPKIRVNAWNSLLQARAIENLCYTIGVNRIGVDGNNLEYTGQSQVIDFLGNYLVAPCEADAFFTTNLLVAPQNEMRKKLNFLNDKDDFVLKK